jgi:hypothetical protein
MAFGRGKIRVVHVLVDQRLQQPLLCRIKSARGQALEPAQAVASAHPVSTMDLGPTDRLQNARDMR